MTFRNSTKAFSARTLPSPNSIGTVPPHSGQASDPSLVQEWASESTMEAIGIEVLVVL